MTFDPDPLKQAQEVIFSRKSNKPLHLLLVFNNLNVTQINCQKHLRMLLTFNE